ncbi:MAG: zinc metallopeptidase [Ardenticatenales bacterium]|nr:zinc metallopeptidase [Ardenticatenales bacterium]
MFGSGSYMLWVLLPSLALSLYAQWRVKSAYGRWSRVVNARGLNGAAVARAIMEARGLTHVGIESIQGVMTDHYDPRGKVIRLSESSVQPSVAAMAIVAHELGHAEQDKVGDAMLNLRAALVPAANLGSGLAMWLLIGGFALQSMGSIGLGGLVAWTGVLMFSAAVLFTLVTLPVEFDASRRAKRTLGELGLVSGSDAQGVNAVLDAAALTYVAAAAGAVLQLLYWVSLLTGRRD